MRRDVYAAPFLSKGAEELNVLKSHLRITIATLLGRGESQHEIARRTGVDRKTIRRYLRHPPDPDWPPPDPKSPTISTAGREAASGLAPASLAPVCLPVQGPPSGGCGFRALRSLISSSGFDPDRA